MTSFFNTETVVLQQHLHSSKSLVLYTGFYLSAVFCVENKHRLSGSAVEGKISVVDIDIALGKSAEQAVQVADLVFKCHADDAGKAAEITGSFKGF